MNKCVSFVRSSSEVIGEAKKWIENNPYVTIICHSHTVSNGMQYIIIIYTEEDTNIKL